jgi:UDP-glucose 4-epimerase
MKVGVTAAGGFLGRRVCLNLLTAGHEVVGIDSRPFEGVDVLPGRSVDHDLVKVFAGCEVILHLEWSGSFRKAVDQPLQTLTNNAAHIQHVVNACRELKSRLVFTSTGIVYGGNLDRPTPEIEDQQPRSYYGLQKLHAEGMVRIGSELGGFDASCVRVFNLYGRGSTDSAQIISRLIAATDAGQPFRLTGDGSQQRDFVAVEDAAEALVRFASHTGYRGECFNLGSGHGTRMRDLAETFYQLKDMEPNIEWVPAVPGESKVLIADMRKTRSVIGDVPFRSIRDGLQQMLQA